MTRNGASNGIYYFIGNMPSHAMHALPLYKALGGTFVVASQQAKKELEKYSVDVLLIDDRPKQSLSFGRSIINTIKYLNKNARVVLFYELYDFPIGSRLKKPKTIFLTHGNMLKAYMSPKRIAMLKQYDYMVALGPYNKQKFINELGINPLQLVDLGIARTDEIVAHRGELWGIKKMANTLNIDETKSIVAYMPTYWGASSIYNVGKEILRNISPEHSLIFRPHPQTPEPLLYEYMNILHDRPNIVYVPEGKYKDVSLIDIFNASSIIIGDVSSVMLEALLADKPLLFAYDLAGHQQTAKDYESIQEVVDYSTPIDIESVRSLPYILNNALARGINKNIWKITKERTFFHYDGTSVSSIATFVRSFL